MLDINLKAAQEIKAAADHLCRDNDKNFRFIATSNEEEAFKNTDFVIITISTGGLDMMKHDIEIPEKYGIYQTVGDSVGPGGWSRLLRNVPYENYGYLTYSADRHTSELFTSYLTDPAMLEKFKLLRTSMKDRYKSIEKARQFALDLASGKEKLLPPSMETAIDIIKAFVTNKAFIDVVNLPNTGQIDNLPRGAVVETLGLL